MHTLTWVNPTTPLPDPLEAPAHGLLAAGADLSVDRLTEAYGKGIFPWFSDGDPVLWWSPDPRMVLPCDALHISRSLAKRLRGLARDEALGRSERQVTTNLAFDEVIQSCAAPSPGRESTWISQDIRDAYQAWHRAGHVHSIEVWHEDRLVGGLFGVCLGRFFFGESMFARESDASKIALVYLVRYLMRHHIRTVDCQQQTGHLQRLGARPIARDAFLALLRPAVRQSTPAWGRGRLLQTGELVATAGQPS